MSGFQLKHLKQITEAEPGNPMKIEGVLNRTAALGHDRQRYLFPWLVAQSNISRIGIDRIKFNESGDPLRVERIGTALEPKTDYERVP